MNWRSYSLFSPSRYQYTIHLAVFSFLLTAKEKKKVVLQFTWWKLRTRTWFFVAVWHLHSCSCIAACLHQNIVPRNNKNIKVGATTAVRQWESFSLWSEHVTKLTGSQGLLQAVKSCLGSPKSSMTLYLSSSYLYNVKKKL